MWNILYSAANEKGVGRYQIGLALGIKTPQGLSRSIPLPPKTHSNSLHSQLHTSSHPSFRQHTHLFHPQIQPTQLVWLKVNLPYYYYLSRSPAVPKSQAVLHTKPNLPASVQPSLSLSSTHAYLLDASTFGAHEDQRVVLVDICNHRGHFVNSVREKRLAAHHL